MFKFLLVVNALIAASLVGVILMQRSEGGGLTGGGNPAGLMSARGAADFLTRATAILATLFVVLSIAMAAVAGLNRPKGDLDTSLDRTAVPATSAPATGPAQTPTPAAAPAEVEGGGQAQAQQAEAEARAKAQAQFEAAQKDAQTKARAEQEKARSDNLKRAFDREREAVVRQADQAQKAATPKVSAPTVGGTAPKVDKVEIAPENPAAGGNSIPK